MLAIAGGKGGCGKTTTTLGLAAALESRTLVVDADVDMPNLHILAGVERDAALASVADCVDPWEAATPRPDDPGTRVLSAPLESPTDTLRGALSRLQRAGAAVLVDCPAGASVDAAVPFQFADATLLVTTLCGPALRDTTKTAAMSRTVGTPVAGAVLTRTHASPAAVSELLETPIRASIPQVADPLADGGPGPASYAALANTLRSAGVCPLGKPSRGKT